MGPIEWVKPTIFHEPVINDVPIFFLQKDHVCVSLKDLLGRYIPPVPSSRYHLAFIPVLDRVSEGGRKEMRDSGLGSGGGEAAAFCCEPEKRERIRGHLLRTDRYCWCDRTTKQLIMKVGHL